MNALKMLVECFTLQPVYRLDHCRCGAEKPMVYPTCATCLVHASVARGDA